MQYELDKFIVKSYSSQMVCQRLRQQGVTEAGIDQLCRGQQITNPRDRQILSKITLEAVSGNPSAVRNSANKATPI